MASILNWFKNQKNVIVVNSLEETTRDGINKAYIPKFLYKPPYGYPRFANMPYIRHLAKTPYVEMCIKTIIDNLTAIDWDIMPTKGLEDQDDEGERDHIKNFFLNPNTNKESFEQVFIEMPVRDLLEVNSGVLNKVYNMREVMVEIVARDGATFTKNPDIHGMYTNRDDIIMPSSIIEGAGVQLLNPYTEIGATDARERAAYFQYGWVSGPIPIPFGRDEIIWIESMKRTDDHYGWSPVQTLANALQMLVYSVESDLEYFNDNNIPKGIIGLDESDADEVDAFKEQWNESQYKEDEFGGLKKMMNKVPIVNKTPTFTRIEFSASEMQIIEKQKWYTKMVWACFGVTPVELGYTDDSSGSANQIVQSKIFRKKAINPILRKLETMYNMQIVNEFGYYGEITTKSGKIIRKPKYEIIFKKFDVDEERQKAELYKIQTEVFRTVNEVRADEGLDPIDGGDEAPKKNNAQNNFTFGNQNDSSQNRNTATNEDDDKVAGENGNVDENPENDSRNTKEPNSKDLSNDEIKKIDEVIDYMESRFNVDKKDYPLGNPLLLGENERPTSPKVLEDAIKFVLSNNEKDLNKLVAEATKPDIIGDIKDFSGIIGKMKVLFSLASLKAITTAIINNNYMKGFEEAEVEIQMNMVPDRAAMDFIADYTFDNIKDMNEQNIKSLRQVLQRGFMDGKGAKEIQKDISKVFDISENRALAIARTETQRALGTGKLHAYMKSGLKVKKYISVHIDDRTSGLCRDLNKKYGNEDQAIPIEDRFNFDGDEWMTNPFHVNCRSSVLYEFDE